MAIATISPVTGETVKSFDDSALITSEMGKTLRAGQEEVAKWVNAKTVWIGDDAGA